MQKRLNFEKMKQKKDSKRLNLSKKRDIKLHFGSKLHCIIDRDYELVRRFKTTTTSLNDSQVDSSKK